MASLLILNANVINEGSITQTDVFIQNQRIEIIASNLSYKPADQVIDAAGRFLLPGMIDSHVHFCEPGLTHKGSIASESRAAIVGGVTSFIDMPDSLPYVLSAEAIVGKKALAQGQSWANYGFYLGASTTNLEEIKMIDPSTVGGIKVLTGELSHGQLSGDDPENLAAIFQVAPTLVAMHCEDMPTIWENEESYRSIYGDRIPMALHPMIRSEEACYVSSVQAIELAQRYKTRLHLLQLSTARELDLLSNLPVISKTITAEVSPHYLIFADNDYATQQALIKCNPAIKTATDRAALLQAILEGKIDVISSGHLPHTWSEKHELDYFKIPSGVPMVQHALVALLESYHDGLFSLEMIVDKTSHAVATLFDIQERGFIREGYWADLVLVDLAEPWQATHEQCYYRCGWTPFAGSEFRSTIEATIVNGQLLWFEGKFMSVAPSGLALAFTRA